MCIKKTYTFFKTRKNHYIYINSLKFDLPHKIQKKQSTQEAMDMIIKIYGKNKPETKKSALYQPQIRKLHRNIPYMHNKENPCKIIKLIQKRITKNTIKDYLTRQLKDYQNELRGLPIDLLEAKKT